MTMTSVATDVRPYLLDEFLVSRPGITCAATIPARGEDGVDVFIVAEAGFDKGELRASILAAFGPCYRVRTITVIDAMPRTHLGQPDEYALRALAR
jgi:acyl-coenzyme A synthetase/AMP-(fatty) acid ligase